MMGPGKYDDACTAVRTMTNAEAVLVIVLNGDKGCGFSMQAQSLVSTAVVADILEMVAKQIRKDVATGK